VCIRWTNKGLITINIHGATMKINVIIYVKKIIRTRHFLYRCSSWQRVLWPDMQQTKHKWITVPCIEESRVNGFWRIFTVKFWNTCYAITEFHQNTRYKTSYFWGTTRREAVYANEHLWWACRHYLQGSLQRFGIACCFHLQGSSKSGDRRGYGGQQVSLNIDTFQRS